LIKQAKKIKLSDHEILINKSIFFYYRIYNLRSSTVSNKRCLLFDWCHIRRERESIYTVSSFVCVHKNQGMSWFLFTLHSIIILSFIDATPNCLLIQIVFTSYFFISSYKVQCQISGTCFEEPWKINKCMLHVVK